jgi:branched-chain amino acid aminotransferase
MLTPVNTLEQIAIQPVSHSRIEQVNFDELTFGTVFSDHMFVVDWDRGVWKQPRIIPYGMMSLSPSFSALHYGQTIFEGMKAFRAEDNSINLFRPYDHLNRLNRSAQRLSMPDVPADLFIQGLRELVTLDKDWIPEGGSLYIRPIYFATDEVLGVHDSETYRLVIFTSPVKQYYSKPLRVKVVNNHVRATEGGIGYVKTAANYARSLYSSKKAKEEGFNVVLWLDAVNRKYIEEYSTMNAFFVIDGITVTPIPSGTILEGITRDTVIRLLNDASYLVTERDISILEVFEAGKNGRLQEAFGTGTAAVAAPVEMMEFNGKEIQLAPHENWKIMNYVKNKLDAIRTGKEADIYEWLMKVN